MSGLRELLETKLRKLDEVEVGLWKDSDLMCVFYRGKEFAHFHDEEEIDIRLSPKFSKKEGLKPPEDSGYHPTRSQKSRWMQLRFRTKDDVVNLVLLVGRLLEDDYRDTSWGVNLKLR